MLTIKDVLQILKKRVVMILIIVIISTGIAGALSFLVIKPVYQSGTKLFIGKEVNENATATTVGDYQNQDVQMYQSLMKTYAEIIQTEDLIERALSEAKIKLPAKEVLGSLNVIPQDKSQILEMNYKSGDAYEAADVLLAINTEFIKTSKQLIKNGTVEVIKEPKVQTTPISPNKKMNILIAFAMSLMIGVTLSLFLEYLDNSVKNSKDIENILGVPVIGMLPNLDEKKDAKKRKKAMSKTNIGKKHSRRNKANEREVEQCL